MLQRQLLVAARAVCIMYSVTQVGKEWIDEALRQFWDLEAVGVDSPADDFVRDKFVQEIAFKNGRFELSLPWRENSQYLPSNYDVRLKLYVGCIVGRDHELLKSDNMYCKWVL